MPPGTSHARSGHPLSHLPKAADVRAVRARLPPASTVTFNVSAPPLGEGLRMVLTSQSPGPEAWTLDASLAGPHQARTARALRQDPTSLHPGKQTPRYCWPVGFLAFTGGA